MQRRCACASFFLHGLNYGMKRFTLSTSNLKTDTLRNNMLTLDQIRDRLKDMNLMAVSKGAGVHYNAIYRLANGGTKPSYEVVQKIVAYLQKTQG